MPQYRTEDREALANVAIDLRARGKTWAYIAEEIGVTEKTAKKWVDGEYAKRSEHRSVSDAREVAISRYEMLFKEAVERLEALGKDSKSLNASGYINAARGLLERIDKLTGAEAPVKYQEVEDEIVIEWEDLDNPELLLELEAGEEAPAPD